LVKFPHFSLFKVPPKKAVFGELVVTHGSVNDFFARVLLQSVSDVIRVTSGDHRSIGSVHKSDIARQSRTITISGKVGVLGVEDPLKFGW
jgi:hypothetical protein